MLYKKIYTVLKKNANNTLNLNLLSKAKKLSAIVLAFSLKSRGTGLISVSFCWPEGSI
jgi:hypothetical protein